MVAALCSLSSQSFGVFVFGQTRNGVCSKEVVVLGPVAVHALASGGCHTGASSVEPVDLVI